MVLVIAVVPSDILVTVNTKSTLVAVAGGAITPVVSITPVLLEL